MLWLCVIVCNTVGVCRQASVHGEPQPACSGLSRRAPVQTSTGSRTLALPSCLPALPCLVPGPWRRSALAPLVPSMGATGDFSDPRLLVSHTRPYRRSCQLCLVNLHTLKYSTHPSVGARTLMHLHRCGCSLHAQPLCLSVLSLSLSLSLSLAALSLYGLPPSLALALALGLSLSLRHTHITL